jgi:afadin
MIVTHLKLVQSSIFSPRQAAHLLETSKTLADDAMAISSTCFKLNSLQLRTLLSHYQPGPGEPRVPPELVSQLVSVAMSTADEQTRTEGRAVQLQEDADLLLPFLLPEDGYSSEIIKHIPNGLGEFIDPLMHAGE